MKRFSIILALAAFLSIVPNAFSQTGEFLGVVKNNKGEAVALATISIIKNDRVVMQGRSDLDGHYHFPHVASGIYNLQISAAHHDTAYVSNYEIVNRGFDKYDIALNISANMLPELRISAKDKRPPISKYKPDWSYEMDEGGLEKFASNSLNGFINTIPTSYDKDDGSNTRHTGGTRNGSEAVYIDNFLVPGLSSIPMGAIAKVTVTLSGISAKFGDVTSSVIEIETKSF